MAIAVFFGFCIVAGFIGAVVSGSKAEPPTRPAAEPVDPKFGPKPDISLMTYALQEQLKRSLHDPSSLEGPDLSEPVKDAIQVKGKPVECWRVDLSYRAKNGFGAMRLNRGAIWMKDGASVKESMR